MKKLLFSLFLIPITLFGTEYLITEDGKIPYVFAIETTIYFDSMTHGNFLYNGHYYEINEMKHSDLCKCLFSNTK